MSEDNVLRAFNCASTDHKKIVEQENLNVVDSVISVDFDNRISARCTLNRNAVCCCESCQVVRQCLNEALPSVLDAETKELVSAVWELQYSKLIVGHAIALSPQQRSKDVIQILQTLQERLHSLVPSQTK
ncbi:hypothetical protein QWZ16_24745 [Vibrio ostreicida]|uniref:Uncharacterized protein n=1 Tax=Vibrio ostreicida TaxID=526588 RepID=A0ABT8C029_9VIBR|nr:hypothetical protein [Vibrio ostreicida]MDN3612767.1 hypothetical protein [Vibrio ostreicida]